MTIGRFLYPFIPVNSTEPAFESTGGLDALESTATNRIWQGANSRAVRIASKAADDFYVTVGTSDIAATSSGGTLVLGGTVEVFFVRPVQDNISITSSTDVVVNVTLGYGS